MTAVRRAHHGDAGDDEPVALAARESVAGPQSPAAEPSGPPVVDVDGASSSTAPAPDLAAQEVSQRFGPSMYRHTKSGAELAEPPADSEPAYRAPSLAQVVPETALDLSYEDLDEKPIPGVTSGGRSWFIRFLRALGPGFVVSVGYMDPGNWATDLAAGSTFGYMHLFVILLSSLAAMFLQSLAVRLAVATGTDLAMMCRVQYRPSVSIFLYLLCEAAIVACDLAEVIGGAVAMNLLFGVPLPGGVAVTAGGTFLVLFGFHGSHGRRFLEISTACFVATVGIGFAVLIAYVQPVPADTMRGYLPSATLVTNTEALFLGIGILGATVMPHNLYLHSAIVGPPPPASKETPAARLRLLTAESSFALTAAFFVNCAILIVSAAAFHSSGHEDVAELRDAYGLLTDLVGRGSGTIFAVALLASGLSATITATTAGQVVCEGFLKIRVRPWVRACITRGLAIVPAMVVACTMGEGGLGRLLVLSQVILSLQLPFAVFPLVLFTSSERIMGALRSPRPVRILGLIVATIISGLNAYLLINTCREGLPD